MSMSCMLNLVLSDPPGIGRGGNPAPNDEDAGPMVDGETKITVLSGDEDEEGEIIFLSFNCFTGSVNMI